MSEVNVTKVVLSEPLVKQIKAEIREQIDKHECKSEPGGHSIEPGELDFAEINVLIPLIGNRIVSAIDESARVIPSEKVFNNPNIQLTPLSLISVAYFIGEGSCYVGSTLAGASTWIRCRP